MEMIPDPYTAPTELTVDTVRAWLLALTEVEQRIGAQFTRWDARRRAGAYLRGLRSPVERNNSWQLAEVNGDAPPYGVQQWTAVTFTPRPSMAAGSTWLKLGSVRSNVNAWPADTGSRDAPG